MHSMNIISEVDVELIEDGESLLIFFPLSMQFPSRMRFFAMVTKSFLVGTLATSIQAQEM